MTKDDKIDYYLSFVAVFQPLLAIAQILLNDAFNYKDEYTANLRVFLTALPIIFSFVFVFKRLKMKAVGIYLTAFVVLLLSATIHPMTQEIAIVNSTRFLLPVVIPTGLCVASVLNVNIFERTLYFVSVLTFFLGLFYFVYFISGKMTNLTYSMSFGYDLLIPAVAFYLDKRFLSKIFLLLVAFMTLLIGSRGPFIAIISFIMLPSLFNKGKAYVIGVVSACILAYTFLPEFLGYLNDVFTRIGIESRTLYLFANDIMHDSNRNVIYDNAWRIINDHPFFGAGLFADRAYFDAFCHNIFLEIFVDFGLFGGALFIMFILLPQIKIFKKLSFSLRNKYLIFGTAIMLPLMVSGSYLQSSNFSFFIGLSYLLMKSNTYNTVSRHNNQ